MIKTKKNNDATKKRLLKEAYDMASGLRNSGMISMAEWREMDALCLSEVHPLPASKIKKIRQQAGVSQAVLAKLFNVSHIAVKQWERGERRPTGSALKLLTLVNTKGLESIL